MYEIKSAWKRFCLLMQKIIWNVIITWITTYIYICAFSMSRWFSYQKNHKGRKDLGCFVSNSRLYMRYSFVNDWYGLMFMDPCIIVQFIQKKNPTRCNSVSKFYYSIFTWSSTCFGRHTAHHQEPKTALLASGFAYMESCWTCGCWMLTASSNHTSNNFPRMQNQRLPVQF